MFRLFLRQCAHLTMLSMKVHILLSERSLGGEILWHAKRIVHRLSRKCFRELPIFPIRQFDQKRDAVLSVAPLNHMPPIIEPGDGATVGLSGTGVGCRLMAEVLCGLVGWWGE